jgi:hypothetical protein
MIGEGEGHEKRKKGESGELWMEALGWGGQSLFRQVLNFHFENITCSAVSLVTQRKPATSPSPPRSLPPVQDGLELAFERD